MGFIGFFVKVIFIVSNSVSNCRDCQNLLETNLTTRCHLQPINQIIVGGSASSLDLRCRYAWVMLPFAQLLQYAYVFIKCAGICYMISVALQATADESTSIVLASRTQFE